MEFLARLLGSRWRAPRIGDGANPGQIGGFCGGKHLEECRRAFGERLAEVCATCPD